jgi:hypothetical protein
MIRAGRARSGDVEALIGRRGLAAAPGLGWRRVQPDV